MRYTKRGGEIASALKFLTQSLQIDKNHQGTVALVKDRTYLRQKVMDPINILGRKHQILGMIHIQIGGIRLIISNRNHGGIVFALIVSKTYHILVNIATKRIIQKSSTIHTGNNCIALKVEKS